MSVFIPGNFDIRHRLLGNILKQIREYSSSPEQASEFFSLIVTQLASCNSQDCEPETIYKNAMAIGDFWGLGAEDFKRRVDESKLAAGDESWFVRGFVGGAKLSQNTKDTRTTEEKAADLEKLKKLAGIETELHDLVVDKGKTINRRTTIRKLSISGVFGSGALVLGEKQAQARAQQSVQKRDKKLIEPSKAKQG